MKFSHHRSPFYDAIKWFLSRFFKRFIEDFHKLTSYSVFLRGTYASLRYVRDPSRWLVTIMSEQEFCKIPMSLVQTLLLEQPLGDLLIIIGLLLSFNRKFNALLISERIVIWDKFYNDYKFVFNRCLFLPTKWILLFSIGVFGP